MSYLDFELPAERIAQRPSAASGRRDQSRLLVARCQADGSLILEDRVFSELGSFLRLGDVLVFNDTRVLPCRFFGVKAKSPTSKVEVLLLRKLLGGGHTSAGNTEVWEALAKPMRRLRQGDLLCLSKRLQAVVLGRTDDKTRIVLELSPRDQHSAEVSVSQLMDGDGLMPIPGYIRRGVADEYDKVHYQTVFADSPGSVAAPTAGLHFTQGLIDKLRSLGVQLARITLHVGPRSFQPIERQANGATENFFERYQVPPETADLVRWARKSGARIVAVGTTTVRALESWAMSVESAQGTAQDCDSMQETGLIISPGFDFHVVDAVVTNFHQPHTTHLQLVAAFLGEANTEKTYRHALNGNYRFLSYGDAMLMCRD